MAPNGTAHSNTFLRSRVGLPRGFLAKCAWKTQAEAESKASPCRGQHRAGGGGWCGECRAKEPWGSPGRETLGPRAFWDYLMWPPPRGAVLGS